VAFFAGAAAEPEKLTDCGEPADFDAFWDKQRARLAAVPFKGKVDEKFVHKVGNYNVYAISIPCVGRPATGYLGIPVNAAEKSLPIELDFSGYGPRRQTPPTKITGNRIYFYINAHGQELGREDAYYEKFFQSIRSNGYSYAFDPEQNKDPETAFFNGMVLRLLRAFEYLKTRPEWNGKDIKLESMSQGGLHVVWGAALDPDVTYAAPSITRCCDMAGTTKAGRVHGSWRVPYVPALDYYDPVFMAKRIKTAKVEIKRVGLGDYVSPPSGQAIFFRNLATPDKSIRWVQGSDHDSEPLFSEVILWKTSF
jgi:cephalosporin-C deacetylase-like acetyl esterase